MCSSDLGGGETDDAKFHADDSVPERWRETRLALTEVQPLAILEVAAEVAELADARDSKSRSLGIVGSSPTFGTTRL